METASGTIAYPEGLSLLRRLTQGELDTVRKTFAETGRVSVPNFLKDHAAEKFKSALLDLTCWTKVTAPSDHSVDFAFEQFVPIPPDSSPAEICKVQELSQLLRRGKFVEMVQYIAGIQEQLDFEFNPTRYGANHYLELHTDELYGVRRRLAYVIHLTEAWDFDNGGHLLFPDSHGMITGFAPCFNRLVLFKVPQAHCVTCVSPKAQSFRLTLSGWFYES